MAINLFICTSILQTCPCASIRFISKRLIKNWVWGVTLPLGSLNQDGTGAKIRVPAGDPSSFNKTTLFLSKYGLNVLWCFDIPIISPRLNSAPTDTKTKSPTVPLLYRLSIEKDKRDEGWWLQLTFTIAAYKTRLRFLLIRAVFRVVDYVQSRSTDDRLE